MKIGLFSDIHLEHCDPRRGGEIAERLLETARGCDLIVNAGDTHHELEIRQAIKKDFTKNGFAYIDVVGNHDMYGHGWQDEPGITQIAYPSGLQIVAGAMWTNFNDNPMTEAAAEMFISDFRWIWGVDASGMCHKFNNFLARIESVKPDIVISHFAPSPGSIHPRWAGADLNGYFCPNALDRLTHKPRLWLHGHIHDPVDYEYRGTHVVANPLGYPGETYKDINQYSMKVIEI
jgi:predicted phosphodiesterase